MKIKLAIIVACLGTLSCDDSDVNVNPDQLIGFWNRDTVYLNGRNSDTYTDILNGTNFLSLNEDRTFERAYEFGTWDLSKTTLTLEREENPGYGDWTYKIIEQHENKLILEMRLKEGQYCCDFDQFNDGEVITIREVYKRIQ